MFNEIILLQFTNKKSTKSSRSQPNSKSTISTSSLNPVEKTSPPHQGLISFLGTKSNIVYIIFSCYSCFFLSTLTYQLNICVKIKVIKAQVYMNSEICDFLTDELDIADHADFSKLKLLLSNDVEQNPGPVSYKIC